MMERLAILALAAVLATSAAAQTGTAAPPLSAKEMLETCRAMLPVRPVEIKGAIVMRNRKGITRSEYSYALSFDRSKSPAEIKTDIFARDTTNLLKSVTLSRPGKIPEGNVMDTDVAWLDLAMDYLWWNNPRFEDGDEKETVHGQKCRVVLADPPDASAGKGPARLWIDAKNGCVMQAEILDAEGKPQRRIWGTRVKKFNGRWMANVLETERIGSGLRTKITVNSIEEL